MVQLYQTSPTRPKPTFPTSYMIRIRRKNAQQIAFEGDCEETRSNGRALLQLLSDIQQDYGALMDAIETGDEHEAHQLVTRMVGMQAERLEGVA